MTTTIKSIVIGFIVLLAVPLQAQFKVLTETSSRFDAVDNAITIQRAELTLSKHVFFKYDYYNNLHGETIDDVGMISFTNAISTKKFYFEPSILTLGDPGKKGMETFVDLYGKLTTKSYSFSVELGGGYSPITAPRYYVLHRLTSEYVSAEMGLVSKHGPESFKDLADSKYAWVAFTPKHMYFAVGNEITRTWFFAGTTEFKDFGNFTFANFDRASNDYAFRAQFGYLNVNQNYFNKDNYIVGTSYLTIPPFFYKHFSPISTKGLYSFKVDMKKTGDIEKQEIIAGRQFGQYGQIALGYQNQKNLGSGLTAEYYNSVSWKGFSASVELKYEHLYKRMTGFLVFAWTR